MLVMQASCFSHRSGHLYMVLALVCLRLYTKVDSRRGRLPSGVGEWVSEWVSE